MFINNSEFEKHEKNKRRKYAEGLTSAKNFKGSRAKKLFILGITPDSQENYENVSIHWK